MPTPTPWRPAALAAVLSCACAPAESNAWTSSGGASDDEELASPDATPGVCGDGWVNLGEACDDGVNNGAYGRCEPGCVALAPSCGDAQVHPPYEGCDDGRNDGTYGGCLPDCSGPAAHCGDGRVDEAEMCDDGNDADGDGCNHDCVESGSVLWTQRPEDLTGSAVAVAITRGGRSVAAFEGGVVRGLEAHGPARWEAIFDGAAVRAAAGSVGGRATLVGARDGAAWRVELDDAGQTVRAVAGAAGEYIAVAVGPDALAVSTKSVLSIRVGPDEWASTALGPGSPRAIALLDTSVVVAGGGPETPASVARYSWGGARVWASAVSREGAATDVGIAPDGSVRAVASGQLLSLDPGGDLVWIADIPGAAALTVLTEGDAVVAGEEGSIARVGGTGTLRWSRSLPEVTTLSDVASDTEDRIVAAGAAAPHPVVLAFAP
ncbi:MAG: hypothetical protein AAF721_09185 [Myxococcota bacterium]